jgi:IPT/TIG domain
MTSLQLLSAIPARGLAVPPPVEAALARGVLAVPFAAPNVTGLTPTQGPAGGGTQVTVSGSGMTGASAVQFGANDATGLNVLSNAQMTANSPAGTGLVSVQVTNPAGTSAPSVQQFTYLPQVTGVSPTSGQGDALVTISGFGLANATSVTFDGTQAKAISTNTATQIVAQTPPGVGTVSIQVSTGAGTSPVTPQTQYTYNSPPVVNLLLPPNGPRASGTAVRISGTGFTSDSEVWFDGIKATQLRFVSSTTIVAVSPARKRAGRATAVVVVRIPGFAESAATNANQFRYH